MEKNIQACLEKALTATQDNVRNFMEYSNHIEDKRLSGFFKECAEEEGFRAQKLQKFQSEYSH